LSAASSDARRLVRSVRTLLAAKQLLRYLSRYLLSKVVCMEYSIALKRKIGLLAEQDILAMMVYIYNV
jgi:hypothetical protein